VRGRQLLQQRLAAGRARGEGGVLLDGFPRTRSQAETLLRFSDVQLALNLHLQEEVPAPPTSCSAVQCSTCACRPRPAA